MNANLFETMMLCKKTCFAMLFLLSALLAACQPLSQAESSGAVDIHFCHLVDCNEVFNEFARGADSLSCAFYELKDQGLRSLLLEREARVLIDEGEELRGAKVRAGPGIMHNKFCVVNRSVIITGSHNPTVDARDDYNNLIVIRSRPLARSYERWLKKGDEQGAKVMHDGFLIESCFSPVGNCKGRLLSALQGADESLSFALFTFTDEDVARAIIERHEAGVEVMGVVESWQARSRNQYYALEAAGVPVFLELSDRLQHNKVFVIDDRLVITGSYNPTLAAATINDENLLFIHQEGIAGAYGALVRSIINDTQTFK